MNVACPTCGADVEFRFDDTYVRICSACQAAVLRSDRGIETLGKLADLVPLGSPLRLFAEGRYGSTSFQLVGMAQLRHGAGGLVQEWYARLGAGHWAWLAEAQGRYYLTYAYAHAHVPAFGALAPGARVTIGDRSYTVDEVGHARYLSALGEIPYRLVPNATHAFADLSDEHGAFATIDYGDPGAGDTPTVYVGHQVALADLGITGGEAAPAAASRAQGAKLACPNCGGSLELRAPDQTLRVACPYCNHLVSVEHGDLAALGWLGRKPTPRIPLGSVGKFADGELTVIGYLERSARVDGQWWPFEEYLLYRPEVGFRWLVLSDGHWSYVQPVAPGAVELAPVRYDGVTFALFQAADLRVDVVLGEFYWRVQAGERVVGQDYIAPPATLSCETSKTEQTWSLSTYVRPAEVSRAFGAIAIAHPAPVGVAPNQPYPLHGIGKVATLATLALFAVAIANCATATHATVHASNHVIEPASVAPPPVAPAPPPSPALPLPTNLEAPPPPESPNIVFTAPFHLDAGKNVEIALAATLVNNWAYVAVDLVNEDTGALVSFDKNIEYYAGVDGGEAWTEGSQRASQALAPLPAGAYVLRLESQTGSRAGVPLAVVVRQDVFRPRYLWWALGLLGVPFGMIAFHAFNFRKKRWENASPVRDPLGDDDDDT